MIIYFTGTGNSRYLAESISKQINDDMIDATKLIKNGKSPSFNSEKPYIFVAPVYAWRLPRIFEKWMRKCKFEGNQRAYFIMNCGDSIGAAEKYIEKLAVQMNFEYMGTAEVVMPENYIVMFSAPAKEEDKEIISKADKQTEELCRQISDGEKLDRVKVTFAGRLCSGIVNSCFYTFYIGAGKFYATDACISCGRCVESCMLNNITLNEGKPVWGKACTHCMACISKCPTEAIEYGRNTKGKRRYTFGKS